MASLVAAFERRKKQEETNKVIERINSLLTRKDIVNLENDKVDALRMLAFHLESNKEMSSARLVKFLKA